MWYVKAALQTLSIVHQVVCTTAETLNEAVTLQSIQYVQKVLRWH